MAVRYEIEIEQIAGAIFSTMLSMEMARTEEGAPCVRDALVAAVQISGAWTGSVVLILPRPTARASAAAMLSLSDGEVRECDEQEVAAELVNMIGGNLKSLLPSPSFLSLPAVVEGSDFGLRIHDAQMVEDLAFASEAGGIRVQLYSRLPRDVRR